MKVMVLGKGGREHALCWKLSQSPLVTQVFCAPGNAGTELDVTNVPFDDSDRERLGRYCKQNQVKLVVIGSEEPLADGLSDYLRTKGVRVFGPSKAAARIESSKVFSKQLMRHADVPTAEFRVFDHSEPARTYVESRHYPVVVKADGLAAGKGVVVCDNLQQALAAINDIMIRESFGAKAGREIVIEKRLEGRELSVFGLVSGRQIVLFPACQDHKAAFDGDRGPNTGGMGAYTPTPDAKPELMEQVESEVFVPIVHAMKRGRYPFQGLLYAGLIDTPQGLRCLEFNARFGDPETQPLMMRLQSDLYPLFQAVATETLDELADDTIQWDPRPAISVVLASGGYPGKYEVGKTIEGLDDVARMTDVKVFHAGTKRVNDRIVTDGGRVLAVTALGNTLALAQKRAYEAVAKINFAGMQFRTDIGNKAITKV